MSRPLHARLHAWQAWCLTLATSVVGGAIGTSAGLRARGRFPAARRVLLYGVVLSSLSFTTMCALKTAWYTIAVLFLIVNVIVGYWFAWLLRHQPPAPPEIAASEPRGTGWSILWGVLGGSMIGSCVGGGVGVAYALGVDTLFSTFFPSIAGRFTALAGFVIVLIDFSLLGAVAGGILGSKRLNFNLSQLAWGLTGLVATYYIARYAGDVLINIPAFQAQKLEESSWTVLITRVALWFVRGTGSVACAVWLATQETSPAARWRAIGALGCVQVAAVFTILVYTGRGSYDFFLLGQTLEKNAQLALAQRAYEIGLSQRPDEATSSYLQFRIGLLYRRLGRNEEARTAFHKVVTKYTKSPTLVARAHRFLTAIEQAPPEAPRHVIERIDTTTEYKSAYCVPNSLSLVLRFWRVPVSAKAIGRQITSLEFGTSLSDAFWYTQTNGLRHWALPLAGVEDVKRFLNADIPLLFYIPQHVLAVFGHDPVLNSLVTYDVAQEDIWVDRPIDELMPEWKNELATLGIVLPDDQFARLPEAEQERLRRFTSAYFHHAMHFPFHHSWDPADQDRALAHLEASIALAPELFFDLAHIYVRNSWSHRRPALAAQHDLHAAAKQGLEFVRHQFSDEETLEDLILLLVEIEEYEAPYEFLAQRFKEGALEDHEKLVRILGLLEYRRDRPDAAIAYLTTLKDQAREPLVLGRALEATQAFQSALNEYAKILEPPSSNYDDLARRGRGGGGWSERFMEMLQAWLQKREPPPLAVRRWAWQRMHALAEHLPEDHEQLRIATGHYVNGFPWDLDAQLVYAESLVATLSRDASLPAETREQFKRELLRTVSFLRSLDVERRWQDRIREFDAFLASG